MKYKYIEHTPNPSQEGNLLCNRQCVVQNTPKPYPSRCNSYLVKSDMNSLLGVGGYEILLRLYPQEGNSPCNRQCIIENTPNP
ncbi:hypothetical protein D3C78_1356510 [compost metagenome]